MACRRQVDNSTVHDGPLGVVEVTMTALVKSSALGGTMHASALMGNATFI
jgi:hypothetical protein